jgi:predicted TIM-barrel enzyme
MTIPKILPVIHYLDPATAFSEVSKAVKCGADGAFLISHHGNDEELLEVGVAIRKGHPDFPIGINLLSIEALDAAQSATALAFPMLWGDDVGVDSSGVTDEGHHISARVYANPGFQVFASVAFKYRPHEPDPVKAALNARKVGFIPTTSGSATGSAPEIEKIVAMSKATGGVLAIASGMTPDNVAQYAPYLSHILVATGIAINEHQIDPDKLHLLIANARSAAQLFRGKHH